MNDIQLSVFLNKIVQSKGTRKFIEAHFGRSPVPYNDIATLLRETADFIHNKVVKF